MMQNWCAVECCAIEASQLSEFEMCHLDNSSSLVIIASRKQSSETYVSWSTDFSFFRQDDFYSPLAWWAQQMCTNCVWLSYIHWLELSQCFPSLSLWQQKQQQLRMVPTMLVNYSCGQTLFNSQLFLPHVLFTAKYSQLIFHSTKPQWELSISHTLFLRRVQWFFFTELQTRNILSAVCQFVSAISFRSSSCLSSKWNNPWIFSPLHT